MYYPSSENKGADQLRGYREADLRLCFRHADCWFSDEAAQMFYQETRKFEVYEKQYFQGCTDIFHTTTPILFECISDIYKENKKKNQYILIKRKFAPVKIFLILK